MSLRYIARRSLRLPPRTIRSISTSSRSLLADNRQHEGTSQHRDIQKSKATGPHMTNTNSTNANEMPSVGADKPPPELLTSVDPHFHPTDSIPENTERMTGNTQKQSSGKENNSELGVGEMEGAKFKVEPLRRTNEDDNTMRARLLYQSRKRGTLESDLLLSTFADVTLPKMTTSQMRQYDLFLDENDWDIYYWVTQEPSPTSTETAEGASPQLATPTAQGKAFVAPDTDAWRNGAPRSGEWAQTVGAFKPAYRPVPARWKSSEILAMLRKHVLDRSAGGVHEELHDGAHTGGGGLGRMPPVQNFDV